MYGSFQSSGDTAESCGNSHAKQQRENQLANLIAEHQSIRTDNVVYDVHIIFSYAMTCQFLEGQEQGFACVVSLRSFLGDLSHENRLFSIYQDEPAASWSEETRVLFLFFIPSTMNYRHIFWVFI